MEDVQAQCKSLQDDELAVLESIYPGCVKESAQSSVKGTTRQLTMDIAIALPSAIATRLIAAPDLIHTAAVDPSLAGPSTPTELSAVSALELSHLPGLSVRLILPADYPIQSPPKPIGIRSPLQGAAAGSPGASWLSRTHLRQMQDRLQQMWTEERDMAGGTDGTGVLWRWWDWIAQGNFLSELELMGPDGELRLPVPPMLSSATVHTALKSFNAAQIHSSFERAAFSCTICFENRKGKSCIQIPGCGCVFCAPCLNACWSLAITEGTLENVSCPSPSCVKSRSARDGSAADDTQSPTELDPELVESVVGKALRDRWESLRDQRRAEIDPTYTLCPRPSCQAAVPPPAATGEDRWDRYRQCPRCNFSFCLACSSTWHGPHTACPLSATDATLSEYLRWPEGSEGRLRIEARHGKAVIDKMLAQWKEDQDNKAWITNNTSACTGCGVRVEKSHGCNHMTCQRCQAHFCYRCGEKISPSDPYKHFNTPGKSCYQKLFDMEELNRAERETAMAQAGIPVDQWDYADEWRQVRGFWEW